MSYSKRSLIFRLPLLVVSIAVPVLWLCNPEISVLQVFCSPGLNAASTLCDPAVALSCGGTVEPGCGSGVGTVRNTFDSRGL